jgi:glucosamine--fructose-6-phosphate aminotransferase (isomerizing)
MCGIVAILGKNKYSIRKMINALKQLEYRGYDSSGIAYLDNNDIKIKKSVGKISELEKKVKECDINLCIGHTRWATHGIANEINAHPHLSYKNDVVVVHNGVIENYKILKDKLINFGYSFKSETDTEIISNLISFYYEKLEDVEKAFFATINDLKGSYGLAMISKYDNRLFIAKNGTIILKVILLISLLAELVVELLIWHYLLVYYPHFMKNKKIY